MGSGSVKQIIVKIIENEETWFIQSCLRNVRDLRNTWENNFKMWENNFKIEPIEPLELLNEVIYQLAVYIKEHKE